HRCAQPDSRAAGLPRCPELQDQHVRRRVAGGHRMTLPIRRLGALETGAQGLGCMGMSQSYGPADRDESLATINAALDAGVTLLDTADMYGLGHNEELVGEAIRTRRSEVVLAT